MKQQTKITSSAVAQLVGALSQTPKDGKFIPAQGTYPDTQAVSSMSLSLSPFIPPSSILKNRCTEIGIC